MTALRTRVGSVVVLSIVVGAIGQAPDNPVVRAAQPPLVLNLHFTATDGLPPSSRNALIGEAESIWKRGHVRLNWLRDNSEAEGDIVLRVLVIARPVTQSEHSPWTVAELLRSNGANAVAIASTIGARRIVDESRWERAIGPYALYEYRLGVVLGRAVAHEIGHYLLRTSTHAKHGLMRARIDAREFADLRSGSFRLDDAAEAHLAILAASGTLLPENTGQFSYTAR